MSPEGVILNCIFPFSVQRIFGAESVANCSSGELLGSRWGVGVRRRLPGFSSTVGRVRLGSVLGWFGEVRVDGTRLRSS